MELGLIVQARLGSTRLPGKIGLPLVGDLNVLEYQLRNLRGINLPIIVAFPDTPEHKDFARTLKVSGVSFFFGDEYDVLERFIACADKFLLTHVIRICSDNPFLNLVFLEQLCSRENEEFDYVSYFTGEGKPAMKTHYGLFAERIALASLRKIRSLTDDLYYHEHVTPFIYENQALFNVKKIEMPEPLLSGLTLRLTLDSLVDLECARQIVNRVKDPQDWRAIARFCLQSGIDTIMKTEIERNSK